jgi:hypothetical protein
MINEFVITKRKDIFNDLIEKKTLSGETAKA